MSLTTILVGSLDAMDVALRTRDLVGELDGARVVVVPTAAAFTGASEAVTRVGRRLAHTLRWDSVAVLDRRSARDEDLARRVSEADLVILCDGSALHTRATWRETPIGDQLERARRLVAVGASGGSLFDVMVDPRGGAPMPGLGYRHGLVLVRPGASEQMDRTRTLLGDEQSLVELGDSGILLGEDELWRVVAGDVTVSRGGQASSL